MSDTGYLTPIERKHLLLGMKHGTACHRLRTMILFDLVVKASRDHCFRCGKRIEDIESLSIEHKDAWQQHPNPRLAFFDLENIAFSHRKCNYAGATQIYKKYKNAREKVVKYRSRRNELNRRDYRVEIRQERYLRLEKPRLIQRKQESVATQHCADVPLPCETP